MKPGFTPASIKTFMTFRPDRLKRAYMATGTIGRMFHRVADTLEPASIMIKVVETRSREDAANRRW